MAGYGGYLKKHTEALVKDVGIEAACELTGKSKATLGRYYSDSSEHADRFMPVDAVAALEVAASYPHVTSALAELKGVTLSYDTERANSAGEINTDVIKLSQRFAMLMAEYNHHQRGKADVTRDHVTSAGVAGYEAASGRDVLRPNARQLDQWHERNTAGGQREQEGYG